MRQTGFEIYVGSAQQITSACAEGRRAELQAGDGVAAALLFPPEFGAAEVLHIEFAVAQLTNSEVSLEIEREEPESCLFVDCIDPEWVRVGGSLAESDAPALQRIWIQAYQDAEGAAPPWSSQDRTTLIRTLLEMCRLASDTRTDLVMVWSL